MIETNYNNYHSTVRDNFFYNPDVIRDFALSLKMNPDTEGRWPGVRSELLWDIDENLNNAIVAKILSCYYDLSKYSITWETSKCSFQLIEKFDESYNEGWIHLDNEALTSIIYLNKNPNPNTGTSLFEIKSKSYAKKILRDGGFKQYEKLKLYGGKKVNKKNYLKELNENNKKFIETVRYQNVYNRCITFGQVFHKANSFNMKNTEEPRLTLVCFIDGIKSIATKPSPNRQYDFDKNIEDIIKGI